MKITLTRHVLETMLARGYNYVLSKVNPIQEAGAKFQVILTPSYTMPDSGDLSRYDACFRLSDESVRIAEGLKDAIVYVNLNRQDVNELKHQLVKSQSLNQVSSEQPDASRPELISDKHYKSSI